MGDGKLPRGVSGQEVVRALEKVGGVRRPGKGDHVNVRMPSGVLVTVPQHSEVKVGLLAAVIRRAGLTKDEFIALL